MNYFHILTLIFVVAKLMAVIHWSWWLVFLPSLISVGLLVLFLVLALGLTLAKGGYRV